MSTPDYAEMTDEELLALDEPTEMNLSSMDDVEPPLEEQDESFGVDGNEEGAAEADEATGGGPDGGQDDEPVAQDDGPAEEEADQGVVPSPEDAASEKDSPNPPKSDERPQNEDTSDAAAKASETSEEVDYKARYEQIMAPFKANGRTFTPESPDDVLRLMQLGANYTKKMQGLQPHLKAVRMLDNNGLLDEQKLNYLIDLDQKNPEAIKKLLRDAKIDPMDIDTSTEPAYRPGNHSVSDQEMAFSEALDTVRSTPSGEETIRILDSTWDRQSKKEVFQDPSLLSVINSHRVEGIYDRIVEVLERKRMLGEFQNVPFLHAYKAVGDELHAAGKLETRQASAGQPTNPTAPQPQAAVSTRPSRTSKPAATREQVRAISSAPGTRVKPSPKPSFDPLSMSDEEIMAMTPPSKL